MKKLIALLFLLSSSVSSAALLAQPSIPRNGRSELEVLPPMGFLGCEECAKQFMGGVKGPSSAQLKNIRYHTAEIFGNDGSGSGGSANSIRGN